ncbi:MAG: hypothetical protein IJI56_00500 [Firmicutes bacterium]|nr:hypothetical protein [Bacillota bacterium]
MGKRVRISVILMMAVGIILAPALFERSHVFGLPYHTGDVITGGCPNCGQTYAVVMVTDNTAEPSCTSSASYTIKCPECGTHTITVPALGHDIYSYVSKAASCTENGTRTYVCSRGDYSYSENIAALGHDYKEEVTKDAGCEEDGEKTFTCSRCNDRYTEVIPAIGHDWDTEEKEATCTEDGYKKSVCRNCHEEKNEIIPAKGHDYPEEWTVEKEADYVSEGLRTKKCRVCGHLLSETIPKKFPLPYVIGGGIAGLIALAVYIAGRIKKSKLKVLKPSFGSRIVAVCSENEELIKLLKKKSFLKVKKCEYPELDKTLEDESPDLLIIDVKDKERTDEVLARREELLKDKGIGFIVYKGLEKESLRQIKDLSEEIDIINYVKEEDSPNSMLVDLVLPILKPDIKSDASLENVGKVADALGIPGISKVIDVFIAGRDIKTTLEEDELGIDEHATIIGDIADILGYDRVSDIAGLVGDIKNIKKAVSKDAGAYEAKKGVKGAKDIAEVVTDIADGED